MKIKFILAIILLTCNLGYAQEILNYHNYNGSVFTVKDGRKKEQEITLHFEKMPTLENKIKHIRGKSVEGSYITGIIVNDSHCTVEIAIVIELYSKSNNYVNKVYASCHSLAPNQKGYFETQVNIENKIENYGLKIEQVYADSEKKGYSWEEVIFGLVIILANIVPITLSLIQDHKLSATIIITFLVIGTIIITYLKTKNKKRNKEENKFNESKK